MHSPTPTSSRWKAFVACLVAVGVVIVVGLNRPTASPPEPTDPFSLPSGQVVDLDIGKKKMRELQQRRDEALRIGILREDDSSWVKAKLYEGDRKWAIRIRLKGDWTDHLEGEKWSFRVEVRDSLPWRRLRVFSLQSPERRGYLNEWLLHRVLAREGLLTPYYEFIHLRLNGHDLGIYAIEEHFTKELLERQHRREGPILKLDESGMWDARAAAMADSAFPYLQIPFFEAAPVLPFQKNHLLKDDELRVQLGHAQRLMRQYREDHHWRDQTVDDSMLVVTNGTPAYRFKQVFDIASSAKQYALIDLFAAYHSLIWHNRRYYFNPITQKLEPVVFDGFSGPVNDTYIPYPFWGYQLHGQGRDDAAYRDVTSVYIFQDPDFLRAYYRQLERYTAPAFMDSVLTELGEDLADRAQRLRAEYWDYAFDPSPIVAQAAAIRQALTDGLAPSHLTVSVSDDIYCHPRCAHIRNLGPLPIEVWAEGQAATAQLLEPNAGQAHLQEAVVHVAAGQQIFYRLPGCQQQYVLDWEQ